MMSPKITVRSVGHHVNHAFFHIWDDDREAAQRWAAELTSATPARRRSAGGQEPRGRSEAEPGGPTLARPSEPAG